MCEVKNLGVIIYYFFSVSNPVNHMQMKPHLGVYSTMRTRAIHVADTNSQYLHNTPMSLRIITVPAQHNEYRIILLL